MSRSRILAQLPLLTEISGEPCLDLDDRALIGVDAEAARLDLILEGAETVDRHACRFISAN